MLPVRARRLVVLLAALTALVLTGCAGVTTTSGPTGVGGQNRVWPFTPAAQLLAPPTTSQSSCSRPGFTASAIGMASGFCVAAEGEPAALLRYAEGGGHHIPAQSAFRGAAGYDSAEALAIPNAELGRLGISRSAITGAQNTLYRQFAATGEPLSWGSAASIESQALVAAGMDPGMAASTVQEAIAALRASGVQGPTRIPWGG